MTSRTETLAEWRTGWAIPVLSMFSIAISVTHLYSIGVFIPSLEAEFGWSRSQITLGITLQSIFTVLLSPFMGALIDRWGPRRIAIPGIVIFCLGTAALSLAGMSAFTWWAAWLIVATGALCIKPTVWTIAIMPLFKRSRGLALALAFCGAGISSAFMPSIATALIAHFGWRGAYIGLAVIEAAFILPPLLLFFRNPKSAPSPAKITDRSTLPGLTAREGLLSARFIKLAICSLFVTAGVTALSVHFVPILRESGMGASGAAAIAGLVGIGSIIGRLGTGVLMDRYNGPFIGLLSFSLSAVVPILLLALDRNTGTAMALAFMLGLAVGSEVDVIAYLATRYFGTRSLGTIFGTLMGIQSLGAGLGPLMSGAIFDTFGTYDVVMMVTLPLFGISAFFVLTLGAYPVFGDPVADAKPAEA